MDGVDIIVIHHRESSGIYFIGPDALLVRINELHAKLDEVVFSHAREHIVRVFLPNGIFALTAHGHHVVWLTGAAQRERQYVLDLIVRARVHQVIGDPTRVHYHRGFPRRASVRHHGNELGPVVGHAGDRVHEHWQDFGQRSVELVRFRHVIDQWNARIVAVHRPGRRHTPVFLEMQQHAYREQIIIPERHCV